MIESNEPQDLPFQVLPELAENEYEALKADIARNGVLVPVEVDESGAILDGHHRVRAWTELREAGSRISDYSRIVREIGNDDDKIEHALRTNLNRRHVSRETLAVIAAERFAAGWNPKRVAGALAIGEKTAWRWREKWMASRPASEGPVSSPDETPPPVYTIGKDGKRYRVKKARSRLNVFASNAKEQKSAVKRIKETREFEDRERERNRPDDDVPKAEVVDPTDLASYLTDETPALAPFEDAMAQHNAWLAAIRGDIERMGSLADLRRICDTLETTAKRMDALGIDSDETRRVRILAMMHTGRAIKAVIDTGFEAARAALTATTPTVSQIQGWRDAIVAALDLIHPDFESPDEVQQLIDALEVIAGWVDEVSALVDEATRDLEGELEKKRTIMAANRG